MSTALTLTELERYDPRSPSGRKQRRFLCPFCGDDKPRDAAHRSLSLSVETGRWICHRCGERGLLRDATSFPQRLMTRLGAMTQAAFGLNRNRKAPAKEFNWQQAWQSSMSLAGSAGESFAQRRGIPLALARSAGVRYSPGWYWRPALLFPICNQGGRLVAVNGRFIKEQSGLKTITGGGKSAGVFSTPGALRAKTVAIVEGPMDALALALCGLPAVAMMGTSWPEWLPRVMKRKQVMIATDADKTGDEVAERLAQALSDYGADVARLRPTIGKDWNDVLIKIGSNQMCCLLKQFVA